jgi:oligoribonuclease
VARAKYLVWVDLETSGIGEYSCPILEVGLILTGAQAPFEELATYESVVVPDDQKFPYWRFKMTPAVVQMHTKNGLLEEVTQDGGKAIETVDQEVASLLAPFGRSHSFMLAGSGVGHFDRKFISAQMPKLSKLLQYPCLDVGVWRRGIEYAGRPDLVAFGRTFEDNGKPHRGLPDVRDHLNEWRTYAALIASAGEGG